MHIRLDILKITNSHNNMVQHTNLMDELLINLGAVFLYISLIKNEIPNAGKLRKSSIVQYFLF